MGEQVTLENLRAAWEQVRPHHLEEGVASYPSYHRTLHAFAEYYDCGFVQTVEAFAALSPNNDYHGNLRSLASVMYAYKNNIPQRQIIISTYGVCAIRAMSYLNGSVSFLDTVKGKKITAFRHNLLHPLTSDRVTVDGHMLCVYAGKQLTMAQANLLMRGSMYANIEADVKALARKVRLPALTVQATLWIWRKQTQGIKYSSQQSLFDNNSAWTAVLTPEDYPPYPTKGTQNV
jgi:hypothetical protein